MNPTPRKLFSSSTEGQAVLRTYVTQVTSRIRKFSATLWHAKWSTFCHWWCGRGLSSNRPLFSRMLTFSFTFVKQRPSRFCQSKVVIWLSFYLIFEESGPVVFNPFHLQPLRNSSVLLSWAYFLKPFVTTKPPHAHAPPPHKKKKKKKMLRTNGLDLAGNKLMRLLFNSFKNFFPRRQFKPPASAL